MCTPLEHDHELKGILCLDEPLTSVLADLTPYIQGQLSYPFLLDTTTKVIHHPGVPKENKVLNSPNFAYLRTLLRGDGVGDMVNKIIV